MAYFENVENLIHHTSYKYVGRDMGPKISEPFYMWLKTT